MAPSPADYADHEYARRARRVLPGGNTRTTLFVEPSPPYAVRGAGCWIEDQLGHRALDCINNYTSLIHGHAHPAVVAAVTERAPLGTAFGLSSSLEVELAEELAQRSGFSKWRFCNSGTEAVMMALRAAHAFTGRDLIVRFEGSYHGTYDDVVGAGAAGIPAAVADRSIVLTQGDHDGFARCMAERGPEIAAVLLDLMPNRGGLTPVDEAFVRQVRAATTRSGGLLVLDEVITFRLGTGGMRERYDVTPDLMSVGKVIGGGFPIGAIAGSTDVMQVFDPRVADHVMWGGTFSANPISMAAGLAALEHYGPAEIDELNSMGDDLRARLLDAGVRVGGAGSLLRLLEGDATALWWALYSAGILAGTNGLLALSTSMRASDIDRIGETILDVVRGAREPRQG